MGSYQGVRSQIAVSQPGIGGILKTYTLKVPSHQREYAWTDDEVGDLFQDLNKAIADDEPSYFLGTLVTIPTAPNVLEVIDGQQRLATVTILLSQMRRYLLAKNGDQDKVIVDDLHDFIHRRDRASRAVVPRLTMNLADNSFFAEMLSDAPPKSVPEHSPRSHKLMFAAFKKADQFIKKIVGPFSVKDHGDVLNKWITFVEHRAEVILLQVPPDMNCYKMFETLNDRGLATTQADLVKNYLFHEAGDARLSEAESAWSLMRGALFSLRVDERDDTTVIFFRHALISTVTVSS
jgi:uncharacterized protein with ParB-like and HNH nuclease domain